MHLDRFRANLELRLKTAGLLPAVRWVKHAFRLLTSSASRQHELVHRNRFLQVKFRYGDVLRHRLCSKNQGQKRALIFAKSAWVDRLLVLCKGMELAGFEPVVLIGNILHGGLIRDYYCLTGAKEIYTWNDFITPFNFSAAEAVIDRCRSIQDLRSFEYAGARVGQFSFSTALRELRVGSLDIKTADHRLVLVKYLALAMSSAMTAKHLVQEIRPQAAVLGPSVYTPEGELYDVCLANGVDTLVLSKGHKSNTLMLKRYSVETRGEHPKSLSTESWQLVREMEWTDAHREQIQQELYGSYASGDWHSHVGTQFNKRLMSADEIRKELGLDPAKKTAVIFPHILWDASLSRGNDLFNGYKDWFVETVRAACANDKVNWVIKIHPAHIGKGLKSASNGEPAEVVVLRKHISNLPPHVFLLPADNPMSTLSIFDVMDYCVTVRGTVGIEAARLAIPVLNGGTGRYSQKGFTLDPASGDEYLAYISHIQDVPPLSPAQQEIADRFAYGTFILRPFHLRAMTFERPSKEYQEEYEKGGMMRPNFQINIKTKEDWYNAPDLKAFGRWINSKHADFMNGFENGGLSQ
jgi:hypothetical protein